MNLENRRGVAYARSDQLKAHKTLFLQRVDQLFSEAEIDLYELTKTKKSITDKVPGKIVNPYVIYYGIIIVHVALFILQRSKLHMLQFLDFMSKFLVDGSWKLCYMDTGKCNKSTMSMT